MPGRTGPGVPKEYGAGETQTTGQRYRFGSVDTEVRACVGKTITQECVLVLHLTDKRVYRAQADAASQTLID